MAILVRNGWPFSIGMSGHFGPEYTPVLALKVRERLLLLFCPANSLILNSCYIANCLLLA